MNISLTGKLEQLVSDKLSTGMYDDASEVVREGLRLLQQRDEHLRELRAEVNAGLQQIERREFSEHDRRSSRAFMKRIKTRGTSKIISRRITRIEVPR